MIVWLGSLDMNDYRSYIEEAPYYDRSRKKDGKNYSRLYRKSFVYRSIYVLENYVKITVRKGLFSRQFTSRRLTTCRQMHERYLFHPSRKISLNLLYNHQLSFQKSVVTLTLM
jgi:hypothetical protein